MSPPGIRATSGGSGSRGLSPQHLGRLKASCEIDAAAWILAALRDFDHMVGSIVPPVFDAYARVFHPASRRGAAEEIPVRWADVAKANGRVMHHAAEWGSIAGSWELERRATEPGGWDKAPSTGRLPCELATRLAGILSEHAQDRNRGYFGIWEGWGHGSLMLLCSEGIPEVDKQRARDEYDAEAAAWRGLLDSAAILNTPGRPMRLLGGPLIAIEDFYERHKGSLCLRDPPSLWWPAGQSWCVGTDIDLMTTYYFGLVNARHAALA